MWLCDLFHSHSQFGSNRRNGTCIVIMSWIFFSLLLYISRQLYFSLKKQLQCFLLFSIVKLCSVLRSALTWEGKFRLLAVDASVLIWVCANWREDLQHKWEIYHWSQLAYVWHHSLSAWVMKDLRLKNHHTQRSQPNHADIQYIWMPRTSDQLRTYHSRCDEFTPILAFTLKNSSLATEKSVCF